MKKQGLESFLLHGVQNVKGNMSSLTQTKNAHKLAKQTKMYILQAYGYELAANKE